MQTIYKKTEEDTSVEVEVLTLEDYELEGGIYDDTGNGGEDVTGWVSEFVGGIRTDSYDEENVLYNITDLDDDAIHIYDLPAIGTRASLGYWTDSVVGITLVTDWPAFVPLAARQTIPRTTEEARELRADALNN